MTKPTNKFQRKLKELRKTNHLTQGELGKILGVGASTISMYENGERMPNYDMLETIADYFNVNMSTLIDNEEKLREDYYLDAEAREYAEFLFHNPEYRVLFSASRNVKKEDLEFVKRLLDKFAKH